MINNISSNSYNYSYLKSNTKRENTQETLTNSEEENNEAVVYEPSENTNTSSNSSKASAEDLKKQVSQMIKQSEQQIKNFEKLITSVFSKQANKLQISNMAYKDNLKGCFESFNVDLETVAKAKEAISEDGYYGVEQTSERIVNFAKAIAGDNPEELEKMKTAIDKGFQQVEQMWGGELPEISKQTYNRVMESLS